MSRATTRTVVLVFSTAAISAVYSCRVMSQVCDANIPRVSLKAALLAVSIYMAILCEVKTARDILHGKPIWSDIVLMGLACFFVAGVKFILPI